MFWRVRRMRTFERAVRNRRTLTVQISAWRDVDSTVQALRMSTSASRTLAAYDPADVGLSGARLKCV